ncbi:hypothetical protein [Nocardioides sp.]|uniref:hypothetical protein n=1 Tax=Nocardioides sp. TaxID=35761 RepID=UPI00261BBE25|nr:hypothetical protein [Nocardioides sp.]
MIAKADRSSSTPEVPRWRAVAEYLEMLISGPTAEQIRVSEAVGVELPAGLPAPVAAVVLKAGLSKVLFDPVRGGAEIPDSLTELEDELGITARAYLITDSRAEVSAWFAARYMVMTARALRDVMPEPGDVVRFGWAGEKRVISSIGPDGCVYMKGRPTRRSWPNHVEVVERVADPGYPAAVREIDAILRNQATYTSNFAKLAELRSFALDTHVPSPEAIRSLEELLESGVTDEEPFQKLVTRYPALLASTVVGGWKTFVIPKQRLGSEYVPDFLVLGLNSVGPEWVTVELEAPRHKILNQDGSLSGPTRQGVKQVQDWREWLTSHVAYAQTGLHLYGLTNKAPGLVIIGRDDPKAERDASRAQWEEGQRIAIHSWDWLLRHARNLSDSAVHVSGFARENAASLVDGGGIDANSMPEEDRVEIGDEASVDFEDLL